ncbi:EAL domain-containing protein [Pseudoduganella eburnea]|uniref:EAL domain-containing protein n=1 Tax=Massilia eburnea TaxID=1776165 RepID=A0A6L6QJN5_9BURK|nr:EAL domain-containing protein [Massilia eburnea]MTW12395.1 EAL domain-containing protein [Massilia eburnea]
MIGNALELGQFELWCQPHVAARDGSVACVEASVRWRHPERGMLQLPAFADALAAQGLQEVFVLHMVCDALAALRMWEADGYALAMELTLPLPVLPALAAEIDGLVAQSGLAPQRLVLSESECAGCCEVSDLLDWQHVCKAGCEHAAGDFIVAPQPIQVLPAALRRWQASYSVMSAADAFS